MSKADEADTAEVLRLQELLRDEHSKLAEVSESGSDLASQRRKVFAATKVLLDFEARVPVLRDERRRKFSSMIVYVAGIAVGAVVLAEALLMVLDRVSWWYMIPLLVVAVAAALLATIEPRAQTSGHRGRAAAAVLLALSAGLATAATAHLLPLFALLILLVPLLIVAFICWSVGTGDEPQETQ